MSSGGRNRRQRRKPPPVPRVAAGASWWRAAPRRRAAPYGAPSAIDVTRSGEFDGAAHIVLTTHARAGEQAISAAVVRSRPARILPRHCRRWCSTKSRSDGKSGPAGDGSSSNTSSISTGELVIQPATKALTGKWNRKSVTHW